MSLESLLRRGQLDTLLEQLSATGMYVSDSAAHDALRNRGMFNVVDPASGWKADLIEQWMTVNS